METDIISLSPDEMPRYWYNVLPDLPEPLPPARGSKDVLRKLYTKTALRQNEAQNRWIRIPDEVFDLYAHIGRPRPLFRAKKLEKYLKTPARMYYKREDLSPTGAYKINTAIPQSYYAWREGYERVVSETGAGNTGAAFAYSTSLLGLKYTVYQVRHAYRSKPDRVTFMKMLGAEVFESPSNRTDLGKKYLEENTDHPGNIAIAIGEAFEDCMTKEDATYGAGSATNFVLLHHTIIGLETKKQLEKIDEIPDVLISCIGGGANFSGLILPYYRDLRSKKLENIRFLAAESEASARLKNGEYRYDFREPSRTVPANKVYTLGVDSELPVIKAEGLRGHSCSPILSLLRHEGFIQTQAYSRDEVEVFSAAMKFFQTEGVIVALESSYAVKAAIDEALEAKEKGEEKVIVFNLSGNGYFDLGSYNEVLSGNL